MATALSNFPNGFNTWNSHLDENLHSDSLNLERLTLSNFYNKWNSYMQPFFEFRLIKFVTGRE